MEDSYRRIAIDILTTFETDNKTLKEIFNLKLKNKNLSDVIKNRCRVTVNEVMRLRGILDVFIVKFSSRPIKNIQLDALTILRIASYEMLFDVLIPNFAAVHSSVELGKTIVNKKAGSFINAVLRNLDRDQNKKPLSINNILDNYSEFGYPKWLVKKWKKKYGVNKTKKLCRYFLNNVPMHIRLSKEFRGSDNFIKILNNYNIEVKQNNFFPNYFEIIKGQKNILSTKLFKEGHISIQDPAAGAVIRLLDPKEGDLILDVCAAPGTKSLFLAEEVGPNGFIRASDKNIYRVSEGESDLNRTMKKNIKWSVLDACKDKFPLTKKILIDVPCTGTGVLSRRPDIKWRLKEKDINKMSTTQFSILSHMSNFLLPGGIIVYSTCSLEPEENQLIINKFLNEKENFTLIPSDSFLSKQWVDSNGFFMSIPYLTKSDAIFGAVLMKKNEEV